MDSHATLQASLTEKEPTTVIFFWVLAINTFCTTRKQKQGKEGNANSNDNSTVVQLNEVWTAERYFELSQRLKGHCLTLVATAFSE